MRPSVRTLRCDSHLIGHMALSDPRKVCGPLRSPMPRKCHGRESDNMARHYAGNARKFAACGRDGQLQRCVIEILMLL